MKLQYHVYLKLSSSFKLVSLHYISSLSPTSLNETTQAKILVYLKAISQKFMETFWGAKYFPNFALQQFHGVFRYLNLVEFIVVGKEESIFL